MKTLEMGEVILEKLKGYIKKYQYLTCYVIKCIKLVDKSMLRHEKYLT